MKIVIHCQPGFEHHFFWGDAFAEGVRKHGHEVIIARDFHPLNKDLAVVWGANPRVNPVIDVQRSREAPYMTLERGFLGDRMKYTSIGLNGFNGLADFKNDQSPADRFIGEIKPWKPAKELVIIMGQMAGDASLRGVNIKPWYDEVAEQAKKAFGKKVKIVFRSHPLDKSGWHPAGVNRIVGSLEKALERARGVITYSSTSAIECLLAGVPTMAADPVSMAYGIATHTVSGLKKMKDPGREQWAYNLAYTQWTEEEIRSGKAWEHYDLG